MSSGKVGSHEKEPSSRSARARSLSLSRVCPSIPDRGSGGVLCGRGDLRALGRPRTTRKTAKTRRVCRGGATRGTGAKALPVFVTLFCLWVASFLVSACGGAPAKDGSKIAHVQTAASAAPAVSPSTEVLRIDGPEAKALMNKPLPKLRRYPLRLNDTLKLDFDSATEPVVQSERNALGMPYYTVEAAIDSTTPYSCLITAATDVGRIAFVLTRGVIDRGRSFVSADFQLVNNPDEPNVRPRWVLTHRGAEGSLSEMLQLTIFAVSDVYSAACLMDGMYYMHSASSVFAGLHRSGSDAVGEKALRQTILSRTSSGVPFAFSTNKIYPTAKGFAQYGRFAGMMPKSNEVLAFDIERLSEIDHEGRLQRVRLAGTSLENKKPEQEFVFDYTRTKNGYDYTKTENGLEKKGSLSGYVTSVIEDLAISRAFMAGKPYKQPRTYLDIDVEPAVIEETRMILEGDHVRLLQKGASCILAPEGWCKSLVKADNSSEELIRSDGTVPMMPKGRTPGP
jgi:hypothetical protein